MKVVDTSMMKKVTIGILIALVAQLGFSAQMILPMDEGQANHLKAYGITYWILNNGGKADWLLNYRGGSFAFKHNALFEKECKIRGVSYEIVPDAKYTKILTDIAHPEVNQDRVKLDKPPKVAVYSPKSKLPWDDAVTLVLTYAEIPYDVIYDTEVINGELPKYDWLHLHHEDFTGQYGKFYGMYRNAAWYINEVKRQQSTASKLGFGKVSELKRAVAVEIRNYVLGGGFMFAMCSATDSYDIALAAEDVDICERMFDGDGADPNAQQKLNYENCFAFENFQLRKNPMEYEFSNIDVTTTRRMDEKIDYFTLFDFSAKWDPIPTMLTQNHTKTVKGFMGQTTAFRNSVIKSSTLILGETKAAKEARYVHGEYGNGTWSFYGGHDPEDYRHLVGDPPTDLNLHPNSPGYRLILNNVLFPAAKKKKQKT